MKIGIKSSASDATAIVILIKISIQSVHEMVEDMGTGSFLAVWGREENRLACF